MKKALLFVMLLIMCNRAFAQQVFDTSLTIPASVLKRTSFGIYDIIDSLSGAGDSLNASACLGLIDPYVVKFYGYSAASLEKYFSEKSLTINAKEAFRKKFASIFSIPETESYKKFREMFREDQEVRDEEMASEDSFSHAVALQKMGHSDSSHFDYLYKYVKKNGWPKIVDGSYYASFLALHDGYHMKEYLPYMRTAVIAGQLNYNGYMSVLNRALKPTFAQLAVKFKNKVTFDLSYLLKYDTPTVAKMDMLKSAIKAHAPIKYIYFIYESKNKSDYDKFLSIPDGSRLWPFSKWPVDSYWKCWNVMVALEDYQRKLLSSNDNTPYQFVYSESSSPKKKITLCLLY
jgi:hypothetical protein